MDNSNSLNTPRAREAQLAGVIRQIMEKNSQIDKLKIMIQDKTLKDLRSGDQRLIPAKRPATDDRSPAAVIYTLNELIMEYFHWFGYQYSAEMLSTECGCEKACPGRGYLEEKLGAHEKDTPILVEEVFRLMRKAAPKKSKSESFV